VERPALTYRCGGSAGMTSRGLAPKRTGFPFHPAHQKRAPDTCGPDYIHTSGGASRLAELL
jgi:hypothetical protein